MESNCCEHRRGRAFLSANIRETELKREFLVALEMEGMAHFGGIAANEDAYIEDTSVGTFEKRVAQ